MHIPTDSNEKYFEFEFETAHPTLDNKGFVVHTTPLYFYQVEYDLKLFKQSIDKEVRLP